MSPLSKNDHVKNEFHCGVITLVTAGLITMFVCGILGQTGKLPMARSGAALMISIPVITLILAMTINSDGRGF